MEKEKKLNMLRGVVMSACLDKKEKDYLLDFIDDIGYPEIKNK